MCVLQHHCCLASQTLLGCALSSEAQQHTQVNPKSKPCSCTGPAGTVRRAGALVACFMSASWPLCSLKARLVVPAVWGQLATILFQAVLVDAAWLLPSSSFFKRLLARTGVLAAAAAFRLSLLHRAGLTVCIVIACILACFCSMLMRPEYTANRGGSPTVHCRAWTDD